MQHAVAPTAGSDRAPCGRLLRRRRARCAQARRRSLARTSTVTDGEVHYARFDRVPIAILFDNDRAARITAAPAGYAPSDANAAAVLAWMHADPAQPRHQASTAVAVWVPALHARQLQRAAFAAPMLEDLVGDSRAQLARLGVATFACVGGPSLPVR